MMQEILGDRKIVLARELTKIHEDFTYNYISEILNNIEPKGEYVLVLEGAEKGKKDIDKEILNEKTLEEHYKYYEKQGLNKKDIIKRIAKDRNTNKNEIYKYFFKD